MSIKQNQTLMDFLPPISIFSNQKTGIVTSYRRYQPELSDCLRPTLVFLHGFNGSSKSWACQFAHFTGHQVIAVDAPGFGQSQAYDGDMATIAAEVAALISSLVTDKVVIIGHSMGGMLAQVLGALHAELCAAIILSCTHKGRAQPAGTPLGAAVIERIEQRKIMDDAAYGALRVGRMLAGQIDPKIAQFLAVIAGEIRVEGIRAGGLAMHHLDTTDLLAKIAAPVAIFTGSDDIVVTPHAIAALKAGLPQARHFPLSGVGHAPYCEDAPSFNAAITQFLADVLRT